MDIEVKVVVIVGLSPLLMNNPAGMNPKAPGIKAKKIPTPEDEAAAKAYKMADGQLYLPALAFRAAVLRQCVGRKIGRYSAISIVSGAVLVPEERCLLVDVDDKPLCDYAIDVRRVVVQRNGVMRARPRIEKWRTRLALEINTEMVGVADILELLQAAGRAVGVGDFRPERKGMFGRFTADWE